VRLPRWATFLLRRFAPADRVEDLLGDLLEVHRERVARRGPWIATLLTNLEAGEMAVVLAFAAVHQGATAPMSWIDFKLGLRMLVKYPGLSVVGGLAMAFGIGVGAGCFEFYSQVLHPQVPFDEGERVVGVALLDDRNQLEELRILHDFAAWRTRLSTIEDLGASQSLVPNLVTGDGPGELVRAAAMTASTFRMTRVPPHLGRTIVPADESPTAPRVAVIGHKVWQIRFGGDPDVLGRMIYVGDVEYSVVGVMPPGFGFPINQGLWIPLRVDPAQLDPMQGPGVTVFGRLADGATLEEARSELSTFVARAGAERPDVYGHLHPRVLPYAEAELGIDLLADRLGVMSVNLFAGLFLLLVCGNVALLMFARAASREEEIVVRMALGASRGRIVWQLFSESLVLGTVAGLAGVSAAGYGLERLPQALLGDAPLPFWFHTSLSPRTVMYAAALTLFAAAIAGVLPGLKVTSGTADSRLRGATAGGGGLRFGGVWTAVIVVQVAATVTFPVVGWFVRSDAVNLRTHQPPFASEQYLSARLGLNPSSVVNSSDSTEQDRYAMRFFRTVQALTERLETEASVAGVTMTGSTAPGMYHFWRFIEIDGGGEASRNELDLKGPGRRIRGGAVAPNFFDVLGVEASQGRTFNPDDRDTEARTVVVNQPFVDEVLGGRNPLGRRLRYLGSPDQWDGVSLGDAPGPWYRIVGVVPNLGLAVNSGAPKAGFYHAVSPGTPRTSVILVHVNVDAPSFASRLREIAAEVEPDLALVSLQTLDQAKEDDLRSYAYWISLIAIVSAVAMVLSLAGIYSVMSFTAARRTREIGVRVALGAGPMRVASAIFRRPLMQVGSGLLGGLWLCVVLGWGILPTDLWGKPLVVLLSYATLMTTVCLLACVVPMRRALAVEPSEALAADG